MLNCVPSQQLATMPGNIIPVFSGSPSEDVIYWVHLFNLAATSRSLNSEAQRLLLLSLLQGEAKFFYDFARGNELEIEAILNPIIDRFERQTRTKILQEIKSLSKTPEIS